MLVLRIHSSWPSMTLKGSSSGDGAVVELRLGCTTGPSAEGAGVLSGGGGCMADHARKVRAGPTRQKPPWSQPLPP